jgi:hypothetical protein
VGGRSTEEVAFRRDEIAEHNVAVVDFAVDCDFAADGRLAVG